MSRVQRILTIHTTLGPPINFTLQASLPPYMLTKCSAALPRPAWEPLLYYSAVSSMVFLLLCIVAAAYFEADRIYTADIIQRRFNNTRLNSPTFDKSKIFDLRKLADVKSTAAGDAKAKKSAEMANGHVDKRKDLNSNATVYKPKFDSKHTLKDAKPVVPNGVKPLESKLDKKLVKNNVRKEEAPPPAPSARAQKEKKVENKLRDRAEDRFAENADSTAATHVAEMETPPSEDSSPKLDGESIIN